MYLSTSICWVLTAVFAFSGAWFLYQCLRPQVDKVKGISLLLHAVMCLAMIPMTWPGGAELPRAPQAAALGMVAIWFAVMAIRARRVKRIVSNTHHALMAALMVWMVVMPMPMPAEGDMAGMHMDGHAGMSHTSGPGPAAMMLAAYCLIATVVLLVQAVTVADAEGSVRRLPTVAGHAAMSFGAGLLTLAMA